MMKMGFKIKHRLKTMAEIDAIKNFIEENGIVSVRQIFYHLVARNFVKNTFSSYVNLDYLINNLRYEGIIPFNSISDVTNLYGKKQYIKVSNCLYEALENYRSNWNDKFETYVEAWIEKEALANVIYPVTDMFGVYLNPCKGRSKVSQVYNYIQRSRGHNDLVIVYLGDFDPTGIHISESIMEQFNKQGYDVVVDRIALNENQIKELPVSFQHAKRTDPNYKKYYAKYGDVVYELDALTSKQLKDLVFNALVTYRPLDKIKALENEDNEQCEHVKQIIETL